jgi:hypothetical protein
MPVAVQVVFIVVEFECRAILVALFGLLVDECWWWIVENEERFGDAVECFGSVWIDTIAAFQIP